MTLLTLSAKDDSGDDTFRTWCWSLWNIVKALTLLGEAFGPVLFFGSGGGGDSSSSGFFPASGGDSSSSGFFPASVFPASFNFRSAI